LLYSGTNSRPDRSEPVPPQTVPISHVILLPELPRGLRNLASCPSVELRQPVWAVASLANPYQQYGFGGYGAPPQHPGPEETDTAPVTTASYHQLLSAGFQPQDQYIQPTVHDYQPQQQQHAVQPLLASQIAAAEPAYTLDTQLVPAQMQRAMSASQVSSSQYGTPYESPDVHRFQTTQQHSSASSSARKRSHPDDYAYDYQGLTQQLQAHTGPNVVSAALELTPYGHHAQLQSNASPFFLPTQRHSIASPQGAYQAFQPPTFPHEQFHRHRLPNQPPASKTPRMGGSFAESSSGTAEDHGPPSVVGQPGMPDPAQRPKGPKLKFTAEDDALLVELKETKNLTWKQIADFFPGRSSGTLQVRYCTKLKAKTTVWTDEMVREDVGDHVPAAAAAHTTVGAR